MHVSCIAARFFTAEAPGNPAGHAMLSIRLTSKGLGQKYHLPLVFHQALLFHWSGLSNIPQASQSYLLWFLR